MASLRTEIEDVLACPAIPGAARHAYPLAGNPEMMISPEPDRELHEPGNAV